MTKKEYSKIYKFGKIDYKGTGKKTNLVEIELELKHEGRKFIFSARGNVWNMGHTDIEMGGQCIDSIWNEFSGQIDNPSLYKEIMQLWKKWHLNDMHAGCKHQRKFESMPYEENKNKTCDICKYTYGTSWNYEDIENGDLRRIMSLLDISGQDIYFLTR